MSISAFSGWNCPTAWLDNTLVTHFLNIVGENREIQKLCKQCWFLLRWLHTCYDKWKVNLWLTLHTLCNCLQVHQVVTIVIIIVLIGSIVLHQQVRVWGICLQGSGDWWPQCCSSCCSSEQDHLCVWVPTKPWKQRYICTTHHVQKGKIFTVNF